MDLAEQFTCGTVAADPIFLWIAPAHATPDISLNVSSHAIRQGRCEAISVDFAVGDLTGIDIDIEHADMRRISWSLGYPAVDDVELLLVRRKANAIGLCEVIHNDLDFASLRIDAED